MVHTRLVDGRVSFALGAFGFAEGIARGDGRERPELPVHRATHRPLPLELERVRSVSVE